MFHEKNALAAAVLLLAVWLFFVGIEDPLGSTLTMIIAVVAGVLAVISART